MIFGSFTEHNLRMNGCWISQWTVQGGAERERNVVVAMEESRKGWLESSPVFQAMG